MKAMLGGMTMARPEATETTAVAKGLSYPAAAMPGMRMSPRAATVAGPDPLTAPQKVATTVARASPPVAEPTSSSMRSMMRSAMPAFSMMTPARMKKGMARRGNLAIPAKKL
jgi:hypothetical protein